MRSSGHTSGVCFSSCVFFPLPLAPPCQPSSLPAFPKAVFSRLPDPAGRGDNTLGESFISREAPRDVAGDPVCMCVCGGVALGRGLPAFRVCRISGIGGVLALKVPGYIYSYFEN